jgi:hypothetical protein
VVSRDAALRNLRVADGSSQLMKAMAAEEVASPLLEVPRL